MSASERSHRVVRLLLATPPSQSHAWREAFAAELPGASIEMWPAVSAAPDYVAVWKPPAVLFREIERPKAIFNLGAGVDALLRMRELPADIPIVRLEDAGMAQQMAQYVTLAVLAAHRSERAYAAQQKSRSWQAIATDPTGSFEVGILGLGVLGRACADALRMLGYPVLGWSRTPTHIAGISTFSGRDGFDTVLGRSRVLVCLLPLTDDTLDLLDLNALSRLPRGAHLVNVSRGELVVEQDLLELLDRGHLSGATLDVFRDEPLPAGHPFWHHPGIVVTPHISAVTQLPEAAAQIAAKIVRLESHEAVTGVVDRVRGY